MEKSTIHLIGRLGVRIRVELFGGPGRNYLEHSSDEIANGLFSVSEKTVVQVGSSLVDLAATGWVELEGPQEVRSLLESGSAGVDLIDQILDAEDVVLSKRLFNCEVRDQRDSLSQHLSVTSLVDELRDDAS